MNRETLYTLVGASLMAASLLMSATASAESHKEGGEEPAAGAEDPKNQEAKKDEAKKDDNKGLANFPRISDDEETIFAVQRKAYLVDRKIELSLMPAASFTDRFVFTLGGSLSATYHVAENFGLEFFGTYLFPTESDLTESNRTSKSSMP